LAISSKFEGDGVKISGIILDNFGNSMGVIILVLPILFLIIITWLYNCITITEFIIKKESYYVL